MGLIGITACVGEGKKVDIGIALDHIHGVVEANNPGKDLRRHTDLIEEYPLQATRLKAMFAGEIGNPHHAVGIEDVHNDGARKELRLIRFEDVQQRSFERGNLRLRILNARKVGGERFLPANTFEMLCTVFFSRDIAILLTV